MMAKQTHRHIIVLLVHQVIMIIYKQEGSSYIKNKLIYLKLYVSMIQDLSYNCNMVQHKLVDTRDLFSVVSLFSW
jgi:hypothetical protein